MRAPSCPDRRSAAHECVDLRHLRRREKVSQPGIVALISRSDIDMAKGAPMALHGCDPDEAFGRLVSESQRRNMKVRDVVREMLDRLQQRSKCTGT